MLREVASTFFWFRFVWLEFRKFYFSYYYYISISIMIFYFVSLQGPLEAPPNKMDRLIGTLKIEHAGTISRAIYLLSLLYLMALKNILSKQRVPCDLVLSSKTPRHWLVGSKFMPTPKDRNILQDCLALQIQQWFIARYVSWWYEHERNHLNVEKFLFGALGPDPNPLWVS